MALWSKFTEDTAYAAYVALLEAIGVPAAQDTGRTPEEVVEAYLAALQQVPVSMLVARHERELDLDRPARQAYEAYFRMRNGRSVKGGALYEWDDMIKHYPDTAYAWRAAAKAAQAREHEE
jgi:hypothetical protein